MVQTVERFKSEVGNPETMVLQDPLVCVVSWAPKDQQGCRRVTQDYTGAAVVCVKDIGPFGKYGHRLRSIWRLYCGPTDGLEKEPVPLSLPETLTVAPMTSCRAYRGRLSVVLQAVEEDFGEADSAGRKVL